MNFEQRLDNKLEHWFELPLIEKIKTGCTVAVCGTLLAAGLVLFIAGMYAIPVLLETF